MAGLALGDGIGNVGKREEAYQAIKDTAMQNRSGLSTYKTIGYVASRPGEQAAYYVRVLEIPTPRWSTLLAIEHKLPFPTGVAITEQQRAWSSPIWYAPVGKPY